MKKEYHHFAFGLFIEEVLKCEKVGISAMCQAIGMSKETYEMLKKRDDKCLNYYERIFNYYYDTLTEEEFLKKMHEWSLRYIRYRKKQEEEKESARKFSDQ
ncbi:hypothetical protein NXV10_17145 [Bacteroides thetaiotaomicron]|nr:hypothetical protein [Bacteroides thetaiotaomicron]